VGHVLRKPDSREGPIAKFVEDPVPRGVTIGTRERVAKMHRVVSTRFVGPDVLDVVTIEVETFKRGCPLLDRFARRHGAGLIFDQA
jgi:hypothetical protein